MSHRDTLSDKFYNPILNSFPNIRERGCNIKICMYSIPKEIVAVSRELRKNMTQSEKIFWSHIKWEKLWVKFLRQHPVHILTEDNWFHRFVIPDFYNHTHKVIVEIDGSIHNTPEVVELDREKELLLSKRWYTVIRFTNSEISGNIQRCISQLQNSLIKS